MAGVGTVSHVEMRWRRRRRRLWGSLVHARRVDTVQSRARGTSHKPHRQTWYGGRGAYAGGCMALLQGLHFKEIPGAQRLHFEEIQGYWGYILRKCQGSRGDISRKFRATGLRFQGGLKEVHEWDGQAGKRAAARPGQRVSGHPRLCEGRHDPGRQILLCRTEIRAPANPFPPAADQQKRVLWCQAGRQIPL